VTVDVLKDGWVRVPIPAGLLVREARLDGKLVSLSTYVVAKPAASSPHFFLIRSGRSLLEIALPVATSAGEESISLPSAAAGVTRASVQIPRQAWTPPRGRPSSEKSETAAESKWIAYAAAMKSSPSPGGEKTRPFRATQPLRLRGSLTQLLGLGEDSTSINAEVNLELLKRRARSKNSDPDRVTINQVLGAMVADWAGEDNELTG